MSSVFCFLLFGGFFLCTSQDVFPLSAVSGEVVLQQFSVLPSDFPPVTGWNNVLLFIFGDIYFVLQALLNTNPLGWAVGRGGLIAWSCWGERGGFPAFAAFPVLPVAGGSCCWLGSWVVDLLSSSFLHSVFSSLTIDRPVGLVHSKRYFLPSCPFTAFIILSSLI